MIKKKEICRILPGFFYAMRKNSTRHKPNADCIFHRMYELVFSHTLSPLIFQELDLTNPKTFRDLSHPMGAQTPDRLKQFQKRYTDWDDPQGQLDN